MSSVSAYILSIAGIVLISVIVELVLCEGQMKKYIKSIFSFFIVGVIIAPLPSLINSKGISSIFQMEEYEIQDTFVKGVTAQKAEVLAKELNYELTKTGYHNVVIKITADSDDNGEFVILGVKVDISALVISDKIENKDIVKVKEDISEHIVQKLNIDKGVIYYES